MEPGVDRPTGPVTLAVSACLLGQAVRYDGTHAGGELPADALATAFRYQPICPEVGIGMGTPRPPIGLYQEPGSGTTKIRVRQVDNLGLDLTENLVAFAEQQAPKLSQVSGYILMKNSPSCGLYTVKVRDLGNPDAEPKREGRGAYAAGVARLLPQLPLEENERLLDPEVRYQFIHRTYAYAHWQRLVEIGVTANRLVDFHSRYKYLLLAFSQRHYREAGQLLSQLKPFSEEIAQRYIALLMAGLATRSSRNGHVNALQHLQGYLKRQATPAQLEALAKAVQGFAQGQVELRQPLELLRSLFAEHLEVPQMHYAWQQLYLDPFPAASF